MTPTDTPTSDTSPIDPAAAVRRPTGTAFTRALGVASLVGIVWLVLFGLFLSPNDASQKAGVRILYIHVPSAWLAYLAFIVTGVSSAAYLFKRTRSLTWDRIAGASAEVGVLFMGVALITGSLWGRISWGIFWTWDSRLTTTAFLFVTYIGYLAVRGLGGSHQQRARRSAIIALLAVLEVPLVHFSVKWWRPLHQQESVAEGKLSGLMLFSLFVGIVSFTLLYVWLVLHRQRVLAMEDSLDDQGLDQALAERRAEGAQV
ncbi:MAG: cytochrome c biogenesis protein CcsA [Actinobacteria bacterium]|nr:cytochrome c biogenesis protein CcsA [Actinomycetota bacterium]